jgi:hypothetical protein
LAGNQNSQGNTPFSWWLGQTAKKRHHFSWWQMKTAKKKYNLLGGSQK